MRRWSGFEKRTEWRPETAACKRPRWQSLVPRSASGRHLARAGEKLTRSCHVEALCSWVTSVRSAFRGVVGEGDMPDTIKSCQFPCAAVVCPNALRPCCRLHYSPVAEEADLLDRNCAWTWAWTQFARPSREGFSWSSFRLKNLYKQEGRRARRHLPVPLSPPTSICLSAVDTNTPSDSLCH